MDTTKEIESEHSLFFVENIIFLIKLQKFSASFLFHFFSHEFDNCGEGWNVERGGFDWEGSAKCLKQFKVVKKVIKASIIDV